MSGLTPQHEARHRIFKFDTGLYSRAVERALGIKLQVPDEVNELNVDLTETRPMERRADTILMAGFPAGSDETVVIIESQTEEDRTRRSRWPYYIAFVHDKYERQVLFLVVCSSRATARWARRPIEIGEPGAICMTVTPLVLGPDNVPALTTVEEVVEDVPFAALSAIVHGHSRGRKIDAILESLADGLQTVEVTAAGELADLVELGFGKSAAGKKWRTLMATGTYGFVSEQRRLEREETRKEDILRILKNRKIVVDAHSREQIASCSDMDTLETWFDRSLTITEIAELFQD